MARSCLWTLVLVSAAQLQTDPSNTRGWTRGLLWGTSILVRKIMWTVPFLVHYKLRNVLCLSQTAMMMMMPVSSNPKEVLEKGNGMKANKLLLQIWSGTSRFRKLWGITENTPAKSTVKKKNFPHFRMAMGCQHDSAVKNFCASASVLLTEMKTS